MDKKMKYKILGVFVAVGLVVILLPFFQKGDEVPSATALITPPAFPDQAIQVSSADSVAAAPQADLSAKTEQAEQVASQAEPTAAATATDTTPVTTEATQASNEPTAVVSEAAKPKMDTPAAAATETVSVAPAVQQANNNPAVATPAPVKHTPKKAPPKKVAKATVKPKYTAPKLLSYNRPMPPVAMNDDGLFALKNPAWVVQLGSFNNKANALKLVNQLRSNGYRAFIQKVSTTLGENTRVFVGPERKHESARVLATQLESDLHLRGIIISYKPLTL